MKSTIPSGLAAVLVVLILLGCEKAPAPAPKPAAQPVVLFNGQDLTGWVHQGRPSRILWKVGRAELDADNRKMHAAEGGGDLVNTGIVGADLKTERLFRDFNLELEFMLNQEGNSGIFLLGQYELQIKHNPAADANNIDDMDIGGICRLVKPRTLAPIEPGKWHKYEIEFRAPRFDAAGRKTANAKLVRVALDGLLLHENAEIPAATLGAILDEQEIPEGPIMLQGSEFPVAFRNIRITPRE